MTSSSGPSRSGLLSGSRASSGTASGQVQKIIPPVNILKHFSAGNLDFDKIKKLKKFVLNFYNYAIFQIKIYCKTYCF